ncbi:MAG: hypothetical protein DRP65_00070 [Planctomycetota bacterium]|nr:MAG: hypothetical protein DRP65_00070 [Planctomycetota bacterium]
MHKATETEKLMAGIHQAAEMFIKRYYPEEEHSFTGVWEAFAQWVKQWKGREPAKMASEALLLYVRTGLGFAEEAGVDRVSRIVIGTVAKLFCEPQGKMPSLFRLEGRIGKIAAGTEASGELLAALLRHLPKLYMEARAANLESAEATVSLAAKPQYEVWTGGNCHIVSSISKEEHKKEKYLFWIDLDEKRHESIICPGKTIGSEAVDMLLCLVKKLGVRVSLDEVFKEVWKEELRKNVQLRKAQENKVDQQLSALQRFCGGEFRKYLFGEKFKKGLGLDRSFSKKYFMFSRLR